MAMELNTIVEHFASTLFKTQGVYRYKIPAGSKGIQKTAPYPGFIFPLSGCAEYQFNDTPYFIKPGVVVHGSADTAIRKRVIGEEDWEFVSVLYETCNESPPMKLKNTHFSLTVGQSPQLYDMLHQLYATANRPGSLAAFQTEALFRRTLAETFLCARNQTRYGAQELFESVSEYIHTHYMDGLTVNSLAMQNGVNENRLFYVFQKYAGMGPADYLRTYRLNRARELLVTTSIPIGIIGEQTGYPDALYFSRIFKRHFGVAPSKFREE
jgi:YesN/AraC family two-component response regulator